MLVKNSLVSTFPDAEISFVKMSSYLGTQSTGKVEKLIGINESIENRTIVVLEDIIDTGISMEAMIQQLNFRKITMKVFMP